jgi:hypothetical protein
LLTGGLNFSAFSSIHFSTLIGDCTLVIDMSVFDACKASNSPHCSQYEDRVSLPILFNPLKHRDPLNDDEFSDLDQSLRAQPGG